MMYVFNQTCVAVTRAANKSFAQHVAFWVRSLRSKFISEMASFEGESSRDERAYTPSSRGKPEERTIVRREFDEKIIRSVLSGAGEMSDGVTIESRS